VVFKNGAKTLKSVTLTGGVASYAIATLATGTHDITATYNGSSDFSTSSTAANPLKEMVGTRRLELLTSTVSI
jgi:hypothetical protein